MARKPSLTALASGLGAAAVGHSPGTEEEELQGPGASDPATTMDMVVEIEEIETYDRNLRLRRNPKYAEIKAAIIAAGGLDSTLPITRRPGAKRYMIGRGGNTRLQILQELVAEAKEAGDKKAERRYGQVRVTFKPWESEARCLIGHLVENDSRGDLTFFETARGVMDSWVVAQEEHGSALTERRYEEYLRELGYASGSRRTLRRYKFAVEVLYPHLEQALVHGGLGAKAVDRLQEVQRAYETYWTEEGARQEREVLTEQFLLLFQESLAAVDAVTEDVTDLIARLRRELDQRCAENLTVDTVNVQHETDALLHPSSARNKQSPPKPPAAGGSPVEGQRSGGSEAEEGAGTYESPEKKPPPKPPGPDAPPPPALEGQSNDKGASMAGDDKAGPQQDSGNREDAGEPRNPKDVSDELRAQRSYNYEVVAELAERLELFDIVRQLEVGYGFMLDLPTHPLDEDTNASRHWAWWYLSGLSGVLKSPSRIDCCPTDTMLYEIIKQGDLDTLEAQVSSPPHLKDLSDWMGHLSSRDLEVLAKLPVACQRISRLCDQRRRGIWTA